jgi:hypothetical protein
VTNPSIKFLLHHLQIFCCSNQLRHLFVGLQFASVVRLGGGALTPQSSRNDRESLARPFCPSSSKPLEDDARFRWLILPDDSHLDAAE